MYTHQANQYLRKLINSRKFLMRNNIHYKNQIRMAEIVNGLEAELNAYNYTDRTMAKFFIRNQVRIYDMIPIYNGNPSELTRKYSELLAEAHIINRKYQTA